MECNGWMHGCMNEFEKSNKQGGQALNEPVELGKMINSTLHTKPPYLSKCSCDNPEIGSRSRIGTLHSALFRKLAKFVQISRPLVNLRASFAKF